MALPYTFTAGTKAKASEVNSNFSYVNTPIEYLQAAAPKRTVLSGLTMSASGTPDLNITVSAGYFIGSDGLIHYYAGGTATATTAHASDERFDMLTISDAGSLTITDGTAAATPAPPTQPANSTLLGIIFRNNGDDTIATTDLYDNRVLSAPGMDSIARWDFTTAPTSSSNNPNYIPIMINGSDSTYKALQFVYFSSDTSETSAQNFQLRINNDVGNNYSYLDTGTTGAANNFSTVTASSQAQITFSSDDLGDGQQTILTGTVTWNLYYNDATKLLINVSANNESDIFTSRLYLSYKGTKYNTTVADGLKYLQIARYNGSENVKLVVWGIK